MARRIVTGIAQREDESATVASALRAAGLALEPLAVINGGDGEHRRADSGVRSYYVGGGSIAQILSPTGMILDYGGIEVPGIHDTQDRGPELRPETVDEELAGLPIPPSQLQNYQEALEAGRCVVVYSARPETAEQVAQAFRTAGMRNVRVF